MGSNRLFIIFCTCCPLQSYQQPERGTLQNFTICRPEKLVWTHLLYCDFAITSLHHYYHQNGHCERKFVEKQQLLLLTLSRGSSNPPTPSDLPSYYKKLFFYNPGLLIQRVRSPTSSTVLWYLLQKLPLYINILVCIVQTLISTDSLKLFLLVSFDLLDTVHFVVSSMPYKCI